MVIESLIKIWTKMATKGSPRKFKKDIRTEEYLNILSNYIDLKIAIWHAWNFLEDETRSEHDKIINELSKYWEIKQTWFH